MRVLQESVKKMDGGGEVGICKQLAVAMPMPLHCRVQNEELDSHPLIG